VHYNNPVSKLEKNNSLVIVILLFLYGLTIPINLLLSSNASIAIICLLMGGYTIFIGVKTIRLSMLILISIPLLFILIKIPFEHSVSDSEGDVASTMLISFLTIGLCGVAFGSLSFNYHSFLKYGRIIAWINFLAVFYFPFTIYYYNGDVNYMRFGYAILPTVVFSFCYLNLEKNHRLSTTFIFLISSIELIFFGARGASLTFIVFLIFYVYIFRISKKLIWFFSFTILLLLLFSVSIITGLVHLLEGLGIQSYALDKMYMLITGVSITSVSSGRDLFYEAAINRFYDNPLWGAALNSVYVDLRSTYYHNIFLDLLANFGLIGFSMLFSILLIYIFDFSRIKDKYAQMVFLILFILPMGRLLVSSSFWQRPEFWLFISFCINHGRVTLLAKLPVVRILPYSSYNKKSKL